jgi:hypothetical protein
MKTINVANDFTRFPSGRYAQNGDTSGEAFRQRFLEPAIKNREEITIQLDGTIGYGSSFLEEAFGGLVRTLRIPASELFPLLHLDTRDTALLAEVEGYIREASLNL